MKTLRVGTKGALVLVSDTETKFEIVSCYGYDKDTNTWCQGHYFTLWFGEITEESKQKLLAEATKHFEQNYL